MLIFNEILKLNVENLDESLSIQPYGYPSSTIYLEFNKEKDLYLIREKVIDDEFLTETMIGLYDNLDEVKKELSSHLNNSYITYVYKLNGDFVKIGYETDRIPKEFDFSHKNKSVKIKFKTYNVSTNIGSLYIADVYCCYKKSKKDKKIPIDATNFTFLSETDMVNFLQGIFKIELEKALKNDLLKYLEYY